MQAPVHKEEPFSHWRTWHWPQQPTRTVHWLSLSRPASLFYAQADLVTPFAEARERYIGRSTGCYQVDVTNQNGDLIATFESSVFRKDQKVPFEIQE